jgi:hypothetical protein
MSVKSRVPDDITDERSMRSFLDAQDRRFLKLGELDDLAASPTTTEIATKINAMLAIIRTR